jgi:hypothetical protein
MWEWGGGHGTVFLDNIPLDGESGGGHGTVFLDNVPLDGESGAGAGNCILDNVPLEGENICFKYFFLAVINYNVGFRR